MGVIVDRFLGVGVVVGVVGVEILPPSYRRCNCVCVCTWVGGCGCVCGCGCECECGYGWGGGLR